MVWAISLQTHHNSTYTKKLGARTDDKSDDLIFQQLEISKMQAYNSYRINREAQHVTIGLKLGLLDPTALFMLD